MDEIVTTEIPASMGARQPADANVPSDGDRLRELSSEARSLGAIPRAAEIHLAMGRIYGDRLGDLRSAAICYQNAFRLDPTHRPNLEAARRLFAEAGRLERARALHEREEAVLDSPAERAESLRAQAALLSREGRAIDSSRLVDRALQLAPDHPALLAQAADAAAARGDRLGCANLLVRAAAAIHDDVQKAQRLRRAMLLLDELLGEDPRDGIAPPPPGSEGEALHALRDDVLARLHAADPSDPLALLGLLRRAQDGNDWETVLRLSRERAHRTGAAAERAVAGCIAAFRLGRAGDAIAELRSSLEEARRDGGLLALLAALAEQQHSPDLPHALRLRAAGSGDASERADLKVMAASLAPDALAQEQLLADALADNPGDAAAIALHARLVALRDPAAAAERFSMLASALREEAPADAAAYQVEAACSLERAGLRAEAAAVARDALSVAPGTAAGDAALRLLQRTLPSLGALAELAALLEAAAAPLARGPASELLARAASVAADVPGLRERSLELAQRAAELARGLSGRKALEAWTSAALCSGDLPSFGNALDARAAAAQGADAAELLVEAAELARAVGDDEGAIQRYHRARAADASSASARAGLLAIPALPRDERIALLEEEVRSAQPAREAALSAELAALLEAAGRNDEAAQACAHALSLGGADLAVLRRLARLQTRRGDHAAALAILVRIAQATPEGHSRAEAYARAADYAEWRLGDAQGAIELHAAAAEADGAPSLAYAHLGRLNAWIGRFAEAADAFEKLAATSPLPAEKVEALRWAAALHSGRTGKPARAAELLRRLLVESPGDLAAMAALLPLLEEVPGPQGRKERADLRGKLANRCQDSRCAALLRIESAHDRLAGGERDQAVAEFRRALALHPQDRLALDAVEQALRTSGQHRLLAQHLAFRAAHANGAAGAALALERGDLLADAGEWEQAAAAYEQALASDPGSPLAARGMRRLAAHGREARPGSDSPLRDGASASGGAVEAHGARRSPEPSLAASVRAAMRLFQQQARHEGVLAAAATLVGLGAATPEEAAVYEVEAKRPPPVELPGVEDDEEVRAPDDEGVLRELLRAAAPELGKALRVDLSGRGERVRGDNPVRRVCAAIANALAMAEPALYLAKGEADVVLPIATEPPGLLVGHEVPKRYRSRQQRFLYARALTHLRRGTHLFVSFPPERLGQLVGELVRATAPAGTDFSRLSARDPELADAVERALAPKSRARLAPFSRAAAAAAEPASWLRLALALRSTAERTALILCGDPAAALRIVASEVGRTDGPEIAELATFAVSETYLRRRAR